MQVKREFDRCRVQILKIRESLEAPKTPINKINRPTGMRQTIFDKKIARLKRKQAQYLELERLMLLSIFK